MSAKRLATHELRLAWRDFLAMATAGRRERERTVLALAAAAFAALHLVAAAALPDRLAIGAMDADGLQLAVTALLAMPVALMVSQAMESTTRLFYSRSDLDLLLSSPMPPTRVFAVRLGGIALATGAVAMLIGGPAIDVLALRDGARWLAAWPALIALGVLATVAAVWLTFAMFRLFGARHTRVAAQIAAAVVGAAFVIGVQIAAIASMGNATRFQFLTSPAIRASLPASGSPFWLPAEAVTGDGASLLFLLAAAATAFAATVGLLGPRFSEIAAAAAGASFHSGGRGRVRPFRAHSAASALRAKEWRLLARDPWLISQTLMQILYLAPPAYMLWNGFGGGAASVVVPVLVMAAGQLAGGLAWLAISGEDARDLVESAPVAAGAVLRAKAEAVLGAVGLATAPILLFLAISDGKAALAALAGIGAASLSATAIQLWFRSQAKRGNFRRRQTSSRLATVAEAFSSILWAAAAGLAAHGSPLAFATALLALAMLATVRRFAPATMAA